MSQQPPTGDALRLEIFRHALTGITDEMSVTLRRAAYSTNIKTRLDFSCALLDGQARMAAQSFAQPIHLGTLAHFVPAIIAQYRGPLENGDAILCNDSHLGGLHLNDVALVAPLFVDGKAFAYAVAMAHHVDMGGGTPGSIGLWREQVQEGLIIPPVRIQHRGVVDPTALAFLTANVRSPRESEGDLRAQLASVTVGLRRLQELIDDRGLEAVATGIDDLLAYTRRRSAAAIAELPQGTIEAEDFLDDDGVGGEPVRIHARITIGGGRVEFDLTGTGDQRPSSINTTKGGALSACAYALRCFIDPDIPVNDGFYRFVRVNAPAGTVVNATHPAPVVGGWETAMRLVETLFQAVAQALPERVPAGSKGMICHVGFGGRNPRDGELFAFLETVAGGFGGRSSSDGPDAVQPHPQNTENAPVEETEINYPVRILRYELIEESEGPGRHRGGLGLRRDYTFEDEVSFTILADRDRWGPSGLFGGKAAPPARYILDPDGAATRVSSKTTLALKAGEIISVQSCGGGGYGPPTDRDPEAVLKDVMDARITPERARDEYGVVVDLATRSVDEAATAAARGGRR
jgi:N-methylhydantoinase B